jgi:hypothetical protein
MQTTISDDLRAAILNDLAELRALREELANTPPPASPLQAWCDAIRPHETCAGTGRDDCYQG